MTNQDVSRITPAPGSVRDLLQSTAVKNRFEQVMSSPNKAAQFVAALRNVHWRLAHGQKLWERV